MLQVIYDRANREPDVFFEFAGSAEEKGYKVIIAGAGMAAHLPGMCAAIHIVQIRLIALFLKLCVLGFNLLL